MKRQNDSIKVKRNKNLHDTNAFFSLLSILFAVFVSQTEYTHTAKLLHLQCFDSDVLWYCVFWNTFWNGLWTLALLNFGVAYGYYFAKVRDFLIGVLCCGFGVLFMRNSCCSSCIYKYIYWNCHQYGFCFVRSGRRTGRQASFVIMFCVRVWTVYIITHQNYIRIIIFKNTQMEWNKAISTRNFFGWYCCFFISCTLYFVAWSVCFCLFTTMTEIPPNNDHITNELLISR